MKILLFALAALALASAPLAAAGSTLDVPIGKPEAVVDLATQEGAQLVKGQWRYSDTKIIEVDFKDPGPDKQPTGAPIKTYDYTPHAGGADFDDSKWEILKPTTLDVRRSTGRLCFNWYRINLTIPERVGDFNPTASTVVFETSIDDYAEIWVDGELTRGLGQVGGSVIGGWNTPNRLVIGRNVKPGQKIQLAIFGVNGPLSNPPTNFIWMRYAKLEFYKGTIEPVAGTPREVNVEIVRMDPALDAIVPPNPKIYKLAEGFRFVEGPLWVPDGGYLLFIGPNHTVYRYTPDGHLTTIPEQDHYAGFLTSSGQPISETLTLDQEGNRYICGPAGISIFSPKGKYLGTIKAPKQPRNMAWGDEDGKTLYMTAESALYRMRLNISGVRP